MTVDTNVSAAPPRKSDWPVKPQAWEEFKQHSELFRFYLGLLLQTVTFALGATAGVVAYLVKEETGIVHSRRSLALIPPALLCLGLGIGFLRQRRAATELRNRLNELADELDFGLALTAMCSLIVLRGSEVSWHSSAPACVAPMS